MAKIETSKTGIDTVQETSEAVKSGPAKPPLQTLDPRMVSGLLCPKSRSPLVYDREANELVSKKGKLAYPIREGVPIMLIEEAREL